MLSWKRIYWLYGVPAPNPISTYMGKMYWYNLITNTWNTPLKAHCSSVTAGAALQPVSDLCSGKGTFPGSHAFQSLYQGPA